MKLVNTIKEYLQDRINQKNRHRLTNLTPTLICSNCTGGFLYHWLGLQFRSPFINLYLTPKDFVLALENFDEFLNTPFREDLDEKDISYPVGIGYKGVKIYFVHYKTWKDAIDVWNKRKKRMDMHNVAVMLTNYSVEDEDLLRRFDSLPFANKIVFVDKPHPEIKSAVYIKGLNSIRNGISLNVYATQSFTGKRFIDQFDYVDFINHLKDKING